MLPTSYFFGSDGTLLFLPLKGKPTTKEDYEEVIDGILKGEEIEVEETDTPGTAANDESVYRVIVTDTDGDLVKGVYGAVLLGYHLHDGQDGRERHGCL